MAIHTSLRQAFTFNYLLLASLPVLLYGLLSIHLVAEQQLEGIRDRNVIQSISISEEVDTFLQEVRVDLLHVKHVIDSGSILQSDSLDQFLASVVTNSHYFESIYFLNADYKVIHLGIIPGMEKRKNDYLNLDYSGHQIFRLQAADQSVVWSNTFISLITGEPSVTLGMPTKNGFLLGNISLNSLDRLLQRYSIHGEIEVAIIDASGTLIAHSIKDLALQRINFGNHPVVLQSLDGTDSTGEFSQGRNYYLESATGISTTRWVVWAGLDMNAVNAPIENMRNILVGFMIVTAILASLIALFNGKRLMLPLTALGFRAGQIADGQYDFQFRPSGFSEIDALASQISSMSHAIKVREESIITNEQRFRDLVNSIDGIVWEMDYPSFRFLFVSQQAESILGYPIQDWYEDPDFWANKTHIDDLAQAKAYCQLMAEKREDHDFEYRMIAADGRVVWIRDLVTVVVENDRPVRLLGVMIDVTEQKLLLNELSRSEENYREIFNASSDAIFIHDAETGKVTDVNQSMLNMFHCSYEDATQGDVEKFCQGETPYSIVEADQYIQEAKAKGQCTFEWLSRKLTGELFWTEVYLRSAMIGEQPRVLAAVRDITARKEAEEQLRELNERLTLLLSRMPIGCIYWTPEFTVDLWNPAAEKIFGFTADEIRGRKPYGTILPERLRQDIEAIWSRLVSGDESAHSINENITKAGEMITCEWTNTPVRALSGETVGVLSMVQDISERKAAEDELARYRSNLEDLVRDRSAQLEAAQAELVQKERLAVLGQLTATVSHEIRNPLGTVANALYMLKNSLVDEEFAALQRPLLLAERNIDRCDNIISDLLDFSRQRKIEKNPVEIDLWLNELFKEIKIPNDVEIKMNLTAGRLVPLDKERLRRAVVNVVINAFQALADNAESDKVLRVQTKVVADRCEIVIEDNGSGMSEEVIAQIFEPMYSTKNFGVGLGVPIIRNIIEGHDGGVKYLSRVGEGTTVTMWLPIEEQPGADQLS